MLDLSSEPTKKERQNLKEPAMERSAIAGRKFIGVRFNCCDIYVRVYVNKDGTAYEGKCPRCCRPLRVKIGEGGTNNRFFDAF